MTLSSAVSDRTLCEQSLDRNAEYYAADSKAQIVLSALDGYLANALKSTETASRPENAADDYVFSLDHLCEDLLAEQDAFTEYSLEWNAPLFTFQVPVHEGQSLCYEITIAYPKRDEDPLYTIITRQIRNLSEWTPDLAQDVYKK